MYLLRHGESRTTPRIALSANGFLFGFAAVALLVAGLLSYVASSRPDGLDATIRRGCTTVWVDGSEQLRGDCIARNAEDHALAKSPLADYTVGGDHRLTGVAGVLGVAAAFAALFATVRLVRTGRAHRRSASPAARGESPAPEST
ncbi:PDGLE domain-containing protein [Nocardia arizonensis]|uniref:PDGLE domain-containing protein n=1 Tax=Nocardia arizonensis TaxID=1141647 RepID=UPI0035305C22